MFSKYFKETLDVDGCSGIWKGSKISIDEEHNFQYKVKNLLKCYPVKISLPF